MAWMDRGRDPRRSRSPSDDTKGWEQMRAIWMALVIGMFAVIATAGEARAACLVGTVGECFVGGRSGMRTCVGGGTNGGWGPCRLDPLPTTVREGKIIPRYYILTVVYAPPG